MSDHVTCDGIGRKYDADGLDSFIHSLSIKVKCYRSYEYCVKWKRSMYRRRASRLPKASKQSPQRSVLPNEEVTRRKGKGQRPTASLRRAEPGDADQGEQRDILDIINSAHEAERGAQKDHGESVRVPDSALDESDDDGGGSLCSGRASDCVLPHDVTPQKQRPAQDLCPSCRRLYQRAKRIKAPIKNRLLDNDPKSLTCDQWALVKKWTPGRRPKASRKMLSRVRFEPCAAAGGSSACARPHAFLQRNLRRRVGAPAKTERKKNRRKRTGGDSRGSRVAKQQHLHTDSHHVSCTDDDTLSFHSGQHSFEAGGDQDGEDQADTDLKTELVPSSVTLETTKQREAPPRPRASRKTMGFRDLLAQLRGNSSVVVRETR
ncbi:uncharacterized protein [Embiotoca jacksoni]|uniref:uncharacterized protein isoform X1 n=2 Tax=Embiotoca jacksoni TaxID=100190 RepID=UPI0037040C79